jgi:hypothetical protein
MKKLTKDQERLLRITFHFLADDMNYTQEETIMQRANCSVGDLYELEQIIQSDMELNL